MLVMSGLGTLVCLCEPINKKKLTAKQIHLIPATDGTSLMFLLILLTAELLFTGCNHRGTTLAQPKPLLY